MNINLFSGYTHDLAADEQIKNEIKACIINARSAAGLGQKEAVRYWQNRTAAARAKLAKLYDEMETEAEARKQARYGVGL